MAAGLPMCDVSGPGGGSGTSATLWRYPDHWAMVVRRVDDGTEVELQCSLYRAAAAVLHPCHRPMSAAAAMLSQGGTSASGASGSQNIRAWNFYDIHSSIMALIPS